MDDSSSGFLYAAGKDALVIEVLVCDGIEKHCEAISFHAQQAAEKMVKGVFLSNRSVPPKIHDLGELLNFSMNKGWLSAEKEEIQAAEHACPTR